MFEPGKQALPAHGLLLPAGAAGALEATIGQERAGEIGRRVEQQRVVLAEEPHDVVAGLVEPIAKSQDRLVDLGARRLADLLGPSHPAPQQGHQ